MVWPLVDLLSVFSLLSLSHDFDFPTLRLMQKYWWGMPIRKLRAEGVMSVYRACVSPRFLSWAPQKPMWWCTSIIPDLVKWKQESEVQGHPSPQLQRVLKASLGYLKPQINEQRTLKHRSEESNCLCSEPPVASSPLHGPGNDRFFMCSSIIEVCLELQMEAFSWSDPMMSSLAPPMELCLRT